jgi:hypothetical protein
METQIEIRKSPLEATQELLKSGLKIEDLKEILTLQKDYEAHEARKAFYRALAEFKAVTIEILKDKKVGYQAKGQFVGYSHATLANIVETVTPELSKCQLAVTWRVEQKERIAVYTKLAHSLGHFEEFPLFAEADATGSKNNIQAIGSTITYLQRYGFLAITGLAAKDQKEDDGAAAGTEYIDDQQAIKIMEYLEALKTKIDKKKLFDKFGIAKIEEIPKAKYSELIALFSEIEKQK